MKDNFLKSLNNTIAEAIEDFCREEYEMPYTRKGKSIYKKTNGLTKKGTSKTVKKAKSYKRTLQAVSHGWKVPAKSKIKTRKSQARKKR